MTFLSTFFSKVVDFFQQSPPEEITALVLPGRRDCRAPLYVQKWAARKRFKGGSLVDQGMEHLLNRAEPEIKDRNHNRRRNLGGHAPHRRSFWS